MEIFKTQYASKGDISDLELLRLHKEYWTYIAEHGLGKKPTITNSKGYHLGIYSNCFLCEFTDRRDINDSSCVSCPAVFNRSKKSCLGGLFEKWAYAVDTSKQKEYALRIANIRMKPEILEELEQVGLEPEDD